MANVEGIGSFKGKDLSPSTAGVREQIRAHVEDWKTSDPAEFHTVEGLDALKRAIGDVRDSTQPRTPERVVADRMYQAVRGEITKQAPEYAKVMQDYAQASDLLKDIERSLSLGEKANTETAIRKLQAIMRNDVSSAYGKRGDYAKALEAAGATGLSEQMAGQAMSSMLPRGLRGGAVGTTAVGGAGASMVDPSFLLPAATIGAVSSPRLVGELAHAAGRASQPATALSRALSKHVPSGAGLGGYQAGRLEEILSRR